MDVLIVKMNHSSSFYNYISFFFAKLRSERERERERRSFQYRDSIYKIK
jgi:hypothetical protein